MNREPEEKRREYTEEELKQYRREMAAKMTAAELMEYIDDDQPKISADEVFRELAEMFPGHFIRPVKH